MNITADQLHHSLMEKLQPFALQVLDESAAHASSSCFCAAASSRKLTTPEPPT
jgi:stress-induced morphogen